MSERPSRLSPEYAAWADEKIVSLGRRVAELESAWTKENNVAGKFEGELQVAEARVAELEAGLTKIASHADSAQLSYDLDELRPSLKGIRDHARNLLTKGRAE